MDYGEAAELEGQKEGTIRNRVSRGELTNVGTTGDAEIPACELRVGELLRELQQIGEQEPEKGASREQGSGGFDSVAGATVSSS